MNVRSYYVNLFEPLYTLRTQTGITTRLKSSVDVQAAMMSLLLRRQAYFGVGTEYSLDFTHLKTRVPICVHAATHRCKSSLCILFNR